MNKELNTWMAKGGSREVGRTHTVCKCWQLANTKNMASHARSRRQGSGRHLLSSRSRLGEVLRSACCLNWHEDPMLLPIFLPVSLDTWSVCERRGSSCPVRWGRSAIYPTTNFGIQKNVSHPLKWLRFLFVSSKQGGSARYLSQWAAPLLLTRGGFV